MKLIRRIKKLFWVSVICFFINAASFLFMPLATDEADATKNISLFITGAVFWITFIAGTVLLIYANKVRREFARTRLDGDYKMGCRIGVFSFFHNIPGVIFDVLLIASAIAIIIIAVIKRTNVIFTFSVISVLFLSLYMHCLFNGRIYESTKYKRIRRD